MGILSWILFGLIAGVLAKWIMPGKDPDGCMITVALGIGGAMFGGWLGTVSGLGGPVSGFSIGSMTTAVVGAIALLVIYRILRRI